MTYYGTFWSEERPPAFTTTYHGVAWSEDRYLPFTEWQAEAACNMAMAMRALTLHNPEWVVDAPEFDAFMNACHKLGPNLRCRDVRPPEAGTGRGPRCLGRLPPGGRVRRVVTGSNDECGAAPLPRSAPDTRRTGSDAQQA